MGKIDQEGGILDHPGNIPFLDILVRPGMGIKVLVRWAAYWNNGAAEYFAGVPSACRTFNIPIYIDDERLQGLRYYIPRLVIATPAGNEGVIPFRPGRGFLPGRLPGYTRA